MIKITRRQADEIELYKGRNEEERALIRKVKGNYEGDYEFMRLGLDELARALYVGYDIENNEEEKQRKWWERNDREFGCIKVGDLLFFNEEVQEIKAITDVHIWLSIEGFVSWEFVNILLTTRQLKVVCFLHDRKDVKQ